MNLRLTSDSARRAGVDGHICELHLGLAALAALKVRALCACARALARA